MTAEPQPCRACGAAPREATDARSGEAAIRTLERKGYTYHGGIEWKPPLGPAPDFNLLAAKNAEIERLRAALRGAMGGDLAALAGALCRMDGEDPDALVSRDGSSFDRAWSFYTEDARRLMYG